ncbi:hypothetical protein GOP47_0012160 [Adiantum capillus-veneris]|uniref:Uncharacterized protein n=1 Tax=Adiantum capillus-veneris TaxID=13818 RepID=A0A9D4ZE74_ADICA|nr:hypothetical protein GOP47_0012160 [Adiantum capillus-veneris]
MSMWEGGSGCEDMVQVESLFDDGGDDIGFLDSLLPEEGDYVLLSSPFDTSMLEDVTYDFLDHLLDEGVPLELATGVPREFLAYTDAANVFKGFIYLFAGMYAFQCLLKVSALDHDGVTSVSQALEHGLAYVGPKTGSCAFNTIERNPIVCTHVYGRVYDAAFGAKLMYVMPTSYVRVPGGSWSSSLEGGSFPFDPGGILVRVSSYEGNRGSDLKANYNVYMSFQTYCTGFLAACVHSSLVKLELRMNAQIEGWFMLN